MYEYAVIRVVPRVEREEFINVGVMLYCKDLRYLGMRYKLDRARLLAFCPVLNPDDISAYLDSMHRVCCGGKAGGPIGALDLPSRFRWLSATRSTVVQTSKVHGGFCDSGEAALSELFECLVAPVKTA